MDFIKNFWLHVLLSIYVIFLHWTAYNYLFGVNYKQEMWVARAHIGSHILDMFYISDAHPVLDDRNEINHYLADTWVSEKKLIDYINSLYADTTITGVEK